MGKGYKIRTFFICVLGILFSSLGALVEIQAFIPSAYAQNFLIKLAQESLVESTQILLAPLTSESLDSDVDFSVQLTPKILEDGLDFNTDVFLPKSADGCTPGKFVYIGRGGLPSSPEDILTFPAVWHDLRLLPHSQANGQRKLNVEYIAATETFTEAQGWKVQKNNQLVLITRTQKSESHALGHKDFCQ